MTCPGESGSRSRGTYHHGNLREALIEAALSFILERGPAGFAFAEIARAVGVSPAAPYRHFRDRNALIAEIARRGYERFAAELERAWNGGRPDPVIAIENCGKAYLAFARREPASYAAMFQTGFPLEQEPALMLAADRAFAVIRAAANAACDAVRPGTIRPPPLMVALHIWALSHGIASLFVGGPDGARRKIPMSPEDLLEAGLLIYLQSLGLRAGIAK
ncbi:MAG: TetR/AcrR family transcriptional regulator [Acetobacteraceae bacterium]|nr:TetR/AcrR family transcriptional regulator [Acetobacteraceae bacterium]MBV8522382.1 TetR/AcrR family transcriptional regulator [Acetobacteraceae bacterium]MBV8589624.1 TetR/AcrR family transcriptional regulator [Acetobacteraceae bacterium]